ncbi:MAG: hypothetical protein QOG67_528 [Verrucomicrobiota bacterium]|jgi:hypothetical protein
MDSNGASPSYLRMTLQYRLQVAKQHTDAKKFFAQTLINS